MTTAQGRPTKILTEIAKTIRQVLRLDQSQVVLAYQKFDVPEDSSLLVVLSAQSSTIIGNNVVYAPAPNVDLREYRQATVRDLIQIDVMAMTNVADGSNQARDRRNEVLMALRGQISEASQNTNGYQLARIPVSFLNASDLEGIQYLERYTASIAAVYSEQHFDEPDYFDSGFNVQVNDELPFNANVDPFKEAAND